MGERRTCLLLLVFLGELVAVEGEGKRTVSDRNMNMRDRVVCSRPRPVDTRSSAFSRGLYEHVLGKLVKVSLLLLELQLELLQLLLLALADGVVLVGALAALEGVTRLLVSA